MSSDPIAQPQRAKPRRRTLFIARAILFITSLLLTLVVVEVGLRLIFRSKGIDIRTYQPSFIYGVSETDRSRFMSHPFLPYATRPLDSRKQFINREEIHQVVVHDVQTNSLGFRTPDRPFEKPARTKRIITLGGSTTIDGPTNDQTWPAMLEKKLNDYYARTGYKIEVINMGVDMGTSPISLVTLEMLGVEFQPDLVISYDGVNDAGNLIGFYLIPDYRNVMTKYDDSFRTLQSRLPKWAFKSYLVSWASLKYDHLFHKRPDVWGQVFAPRYSANIRASSNPIEGAQYFERNLRLMRSISKEYGATFLAATAHFAQPPEHVLKLNAELRGFFQREQIDYLDLDALLQHDDWSIHEDQAHWTLKGLDQVAEHWKAKVITADSLKLNQQGGGE
ncbi:MAG TPA: hypothetical protein VGB17_08535 [Pyrinomonadaceae bacterium]